MGKIFSSVFGGGGSKSKQQSTASSASYNQAFPYLQQAYSGAVEQGNSALSRISAMLGLGGDAAAANDAYGQYLNSTDYQRTADAGARAVEHSAATRGQLGSGATLRRLQENGQANQQKYLGDYLARLFGIAESGQRAGSIIQGAGNTANSQSQSTGSSSSYQKDGISKFLGGIMPGK